MVSTPLGGMERIDVKAGELNRFRFEIPAGRRILGVVVDAGAASGSGTVQVILSHYDDAPKGDGSVQSDETDVDVTFNVSVN